MKNYSDDSHVTINYDTEREFEKIEGFPTIIYKYREFDNIYHQSVLSNCHLFLSPPKDFEDPKDCKNLKRYDLMSKGDIFKSYIKKLREKHPEYSRIKLRQEAKEWTKKSLLRNKSTVRIEQQKYFENFNTRFGVLSLTANCANFEMWKKYSCNGKGFCVGFYAKKLFNASNGIESSIGGGGPVQYVDQLPVILWDDSFPIEHHKQVFFKESKWSFEEEYREHKFYTNPAGTAQRIINVPKEAYCEVIFGWNLTLNEKDAIRMMCADSALPVIFKDCINNNGILEIATCD